MSRHSSTKPSAEKLELVYSHKKADIEDAYAHMFGAPAPATAPATHDSSTNIEPEPQAPRIATPAVSMTPVDTVTPVVKVTSGQARFRAKVVQDAHDVWEQTVYEALWSLAVGDPDGPKTVCVGYRTLAAHTRLGDKTIKRNLRSLETKLAIEPIADENSHTNTGRTYRVYSFRQILDRRREVGLEWVIRNRQGVELIRTPVATLTTGVSEDTGAKVPPVDTKATEPVVSMAPRPVVTVTTQLNKCLEQRERTSTNVAAIVQALSDELGQADDEAARRILTACRQRAPEASVDEIAEFVRRDARRLRTNRRIENPVGALIKQVPKRFEGESWRLHRERQQGRELTEQDQEAEMARFREEQRTRLSDPNLPEEEKQIIRKWL